MQLTPQETKQLREDWYKALQESQNPDLSFSNGMIFDWFTDRFNTLLEEKQRGLIEEIRNENIMLIDDSINGTIYLIDEAHKEDDPAPELERDLQTLRDIKRKITTRGFATS
jgi:hypothetical protein